MSKYLPQEIINENGKKLFQSSLDSNFFMYTDLSDRSGKDSHPDIDGFIRLRNGKGEYLNLYLGYQLKSTNSLKNEKYHCEGGILDFLISVNIPTLLVISDIGANKVYWVFIDEKLKKILKLKTKGNSGKTLNLKGRTISIEKALELNQLLQGIAQEDDYAKLNNSLSKIASSYHYNIERCLGLFYLLQRIEQKNVNELFAKVLDIDAAEVRTIVKKLVEEGVILSTMNYYVLSNEQLGTQSLFKLLEVLDLKLIEHIFKNENDRKRILGRLAGVEHEAAKKYLEQLTREFSGLAKKSKDNDEIFQILEMLKEYGYRVPAEALKIINAVSQMREIPPKVRELKGFGKLRGKSYGDLLLKLVEVLDTIKYSHKDTFEILVNLAKNSHGGVSEQAMKSLENLASYDLNVLKKVGYGVQLFLIEKLEGWNSKELTERIDILVLMCRKILEPSFEGRSWPDYKTMTLHFGALTPNKNLIELRKRTLNLLKKIYDIATDLSSRQKIISALEMATRTPSQGNYGEDTEKMVIDDAENIIEFYLSILKSASNEIVKDIEEQTYWLKERYKDKLSKIEELSTTISSKTEYGMFRVFVGYDWRFGEDRDWGRAKSMREQKIDEFVAEITNENFTEWETKILSVIENYSVSQPGEFQYFNIFLYKLGTQKPELAIPLLKQEKLEPFIIHIIAGVWDSKSRDLARKEILTWIREGVHLNVVARLFDYVESVDEDILNKVFLKAKSQKDIQALNNLVISVVRKYDICKQLKPLFIKAIKELTRLGNHWWTQNVWFRGEAILNDLTEQEIDIVLKSMLMLTTIDYHSEEILKPVAKKYPEKVIDFFYRRVEIKSKRERDIEDRYDAIPFELHKINTILKEQEARIIPKILSWYGKGKGDKKWLFRWEAGHLMEKLFINWSPLLEKHLTELIESNQKNALEIATSILSMYEGENFLWGIVKAIVKKYAHTKNYKRIKGNLFGYLSQTGVVSGEDGLERAYRAKKTELQQFKDDPELAVQEFVSEYENHLDDRIDYAKKRAEEEIELRKRSID